jgi:xanthine dehydrogenase accessory factor
MDGWRVLEQAGELARRGEAFALATVVWRQGPSSGQQGSRAIITAAGEIHGWIGGACAEPVVIREAREVIAEGTGRLLLLGTPEQFASTAFGATGSVGPASAGPGSSGTGRPGAVIPEGVRVVPISCQSEGALEIYIEPVLPVPRLVIVGRSPMAHTLADLARVLGWDAALVDGEDFTAADADERSLVVVATQGHGDEEAVQAAVAARPAYLGLVGSQRRGAAVLGYLADRGVPREALDRVRVPVGLDLGRTSHREIAVAILAELVQLRASGALPAGAAGSSARTAAAADRTADAGGTKTGSAGPATGAAAAAGLTDAVDPVCGMTVTVGRSGRPLDHDGVTYYFCCPGCRQQFESDPAAYVKRETRC